MSKSPASRKRPRPAPALTLAKWHRRIGIGAAVLVVWLAVTGVLLGHTDDFRLDERHARAGWLLDWYGIGAPEDIPGHRLGDRHWVSQAGERIYFDAQPLPGEYGALLGAVPAGGEILVAAGEHVLVLTREGLLAEVLGPAHGVPPEMRAIGTEGPQPVLRTARGDYTPAAGLASWRRVEPADIRWSRPRAVPDALRARIIADYRGRLLTLERVLLDVHSGRLFGPVGVIVVDLGAIAFLILALTGLWMWLKRNNGRPPTSGGPT